MKPKISIELSDAQFQDSSITYNEAGYTYNQAGVTYGGSDRQQSKFTSSLSIENFKPTNNTIEV